MSGSQLLDLWREALTLLALVGAPLLVVALAVGLVTSIIQAATQLNDGAIAFVPKIAAVLVVLGLSGPWLVAHLQRHMGGALARVTELGHAGRAGTP